MEEAKVVKKCDTNMYLVAALLAVGGRLLRNETDRSDLRHIKFAVEGDETIFDKIEEEWYSDDKDAVGYILHCYSEHLKTLKALIHA